MTAIPPPLPLSLGIARYDRHIPFFDGTVDVPDALDLSVFQVGQTADHRDGRDRHERMLRDGEWDAAEVSLSSYVMAASRGHPFTAIPVFPRRLFSQSQMFVAKDSDITSPAGLAGKRVGLQSFQTTLATLAKGDVEVEYGVPWRDIHWHVSTTETVALDPDTAASITRLPDGADPGELLVRGELDALFHSHPPKSVFDGGARRLFPDVRAEELRYFRKYGAYPIMHVIALKTETVERAPWVPAVLTDLFRQAKSVAASYFNDPNWSQLAWEAHLVEEQREKFGDDIWPVGVEENRACLERFIGYSHTQGLIDRPITVDSLFAALV